MLFPFPTQASLTAATRAELFVKDEYKLHTDWMYLPKFLMGE